MLLRLTDYTAVAWTTARSTPECPRIRILVALDRLINGPEGERLGVAFAGVVGAGLASLRWDPSTYKGEQECFLPMAGADVMRYEGDPIDVEAVLATAPAEPSRDRPATSDPYRALIIERGLLLRELGLGKDAINCPFGAEHSEATSDTSTAYLWPLHGGYKWGHIDCKHTHCAKRKDEDYIRKLGADPRDVWRGQGRLGAGTSGAPRDDQPPLECYDDAVQEAARQHTGRTEAPGGDEARRGNGAALEETQEPAATIAEVLQTFRRWLYLPDKGMVYVPLAAVAANHFEGDPVWLMSVGPPSGGKTEVIFAIARLPNVHMAATLTEAALLSGTPKKQSVTGSKGGLLREIGDFGILALKDFTSILAMNRDQRAQLLAALREIFDGSWTRHVGADGGRALAWSGKLGLIAGCTAAIDSYHGVMSVMGERFILYRLPTLDPAKQAKRALSNTGQVGVMRKELAVVVRRLFSGLDISKGLPPLDEGETAKLVALASLVASARSAVERNPYGGREIDLVLDTEAPARLAQTLRRIFAGMLAIGLDRATAWPLVAKTGLDCIPKIRRAVLNVLLATPDWMSTKAIATKVQHPTTTTRRSLEDLSAHGVVDRRRPEKGQDDGKSDMWRVSVPERAMYQTIEPEKSVREKEEPLYDSPPLFKFPLPSNDDISGTNAKTAPECGSQADFALAEIPPRHCWACKDQVPDADRCPACGWIICSCGACSPGCSQGGGSADLVDGAV